ncbi:MAG: sulfite exporter TauE/SafE family protein [Polyangiaceae bacterium]
MSALAATAILALFVGVSLGLLGGGGSILAVPVLVYVGGLGPRDAIAASLVVVGSSSATAALLHGRAGAVDVRAGLSLGLSSMLGAYVGGRVARHLPAGLLLAAFTVMMIVTALAMLRPRKTGPIEDASPRPAKLTERARLAAIGLVMGAITGLVGAGGGFVIVPALVLFAKLPMRRAIGTSLFVITLNSAAGFAGAVGAATVPWTLVAITALVASLGSVVGVVLSRRISPANLRTAFGVFVLALSAIVVARQGRELHTIGQLLLGSAILVGGGLALGTSLLRRRRARMLRVDGLEASRTYRPASVTR